MRNHLMACAGLGVGLGLGLGLPSVAVAGEDFTGTYSQDFNGLGQSGAATLTGRGPHAIDGVLASTGVNGWSGANFTGSSTNTEFKAHDGSLAGSAGRGVIFYGANASSERALGTLPTSNQIPSFGLVLTNTSSQPFISLDISFVGEQWRAGEASIPSVLTFTYGFGDSLEDATTAVTSLDFPAPFLGGGEVALDGNGAANQSQRSAAITGLNWAPGQSLVLRWDQPELQGQDNGLAIDNLSVQANPRHLVARSG